MINAIVVDDEWYNVEEISDLLNATGFIRVSEKYLNPAKALQEFPDQNPDLAFIDIEMPELDGITLAEHLLEIKPDIKIVFVTSWDQYAVRAFDLNALDYILKPISKKRFDQMIDKIKKEVSILKKEATSLQITCFGNFETKIDSIQIKWDRSKAEELFAYLLMNHNKFISKEIIIENLWPDYEPKRALQLLQTSVCRIRNLFSGLKGNVLLEYSQSRYCLHIANCECDLFVLENAVQTYQANTEKSLSQIRLALEIYKEGYLARQGYLWSLEKDEEIRKKLVSIINNIILISQEQNSTRQYLEFLNHLSVLTPYDEEVNYRLMIEYKKMNQDYEAFSHYHWLKTILKEEYDMDPSDRIIKLFAK